MSFFFDGKGMMRGIEKEFAAKQHQGPWPRESRNLCFGLCVLLCSLASCQRNAEQRSMEKGEPAPTPRKKLPESSETLVLPGTPTSPYPVKKGGRFFFARGKEGKLTGKRWDEVWFFRPEGYAIAEAAGKIRLINLDEEAIGTPFIFDNYPDSVQDGFIRIQEEGKVRYFSLQSGKFLKGSWDYGSPFDGARACVCNDCVETDGEHWRIRGGVGWKIDRVGNRLETTRNPAIQCPTRHRKETKAWEMYRPDLKTP